MKEIRFITIGDFPRAVSRGAYITTTYTGIENFSLLSIRLAAFTLNVATATVALVNWIQYAL